jgi:hypothetical protein
LSYNFFTVKDEIIVRHPNGTVMHKTGCTNGSRTFNIDPSSVPDFDRVDIELIPHCDGGNTEWNFTVHCP